MSSATVEQRSRPWPRRQRGRLAAAPDRVVVAEDQDIKRGVVDGRMLGGSREPPGDARSV